MGDAEIIQIILRLIEQDSLRYVIRTNRRLTKAGESLSNALLLLDPSTATISQIIEVINPCFDLDRIAEKLPIDVALSRLARCTIVAEPIELDVLRSEIASKVQRLRRFRGNGTGLQTSEVLVGYLTSRVLHLSSRRVCRRLDRKGLEGIIGMPSAVLTGAAGKADWGVPIGPVPTTRAISRSEALASFTQTFAGPPGESVRLAALTGLSGIGKSTVAKIYLDTARHYYDRILWIDSHSTESIRDAVSAYIGIETSEIPTGTVAEQFKSRISSTAASWLLVFDNAPDDRLLAQWLPVVGTIDVVVTSTNSVGWRQWHHKRLSHMTDDQAFALVRERLSLERIDIESERDARKLCRVLGNWPLAIELACGFLADTGRGLKMTDLYIERLKLHILDDETLVPPEYQSHPSLLQAISVSLETVTSRDCNLPMRSMALLETLAYLPPRTAPIQLAGRVTAASEAVTGRYAGNEVAAEEQMIELEHDVDISIRQLSIASLVHRVQTNDTLWGDLLRCNEIVLEVVRRRQSRDAQLRVLSLLQVVLNRKIISAIDNYKFDGSEMLSTLAFTTIDFSDKFGVHTLAGITLLGNLATMIQHRDDPNIVLSLYRQELEIMNQLELESPVLRAKIQSSIIPILLQLNRPMNEIRNTVDLALYELGRCSIDPEMYDAAAVAASLVYESIQVIAGSNSDLDPESSKMWRSFILGIYPSVEMGSLMQEIQAEVRTPGNDDFATLSRIDERLRRDLGPADRLQLLFLRGDILASIQHYEESIDVFSEALMLAEEREVGLSVGWTAVLNAWRTAAFRVLELRESESLIFCRRMDSIVEGQEPRLLDDEMTFEFCRLVTRLLDGDLEEVNSNLENLRKRVVKPTHLMPNVDGLQMAISACQRITELRHLALGAPITPIRAWGRGKVETPNGLRDCICVALEYFRIEGWDYSSLQGRWICHDDGVGLLIQGNSPVLVWSPMSNTWWLGHPEVTIDPATNRLREVLTRNEFAGARRTVLVGNPAKGQGKSIIDPNRPTTLVKT